MASPGLTELVTTTLRNRTRIISNSVLDNNAILMKLNERGNVRPFDGGRTIVEPVFYADNSTYQHYSGYDVLNITPSDVITAAEFDIKQVAVAVSMSGTEMIQNSGKEAIINWLGARMQNAEDSMKNGLASDMYSTGSASGGKQIGGLQLLVADSPGTGIVGGINRLTWNFWRNIAFDATTDGGAPVTAANIQSYMQTVGVQVVRGADKTDLIIADNNYYNAYINSLTAIQRISSDGNSKGVGAGFPSVKWYGTGANCDVVLDGGVGGNCPTNHMYFLNTKYLFLRPYSGRDMEMLGEDRFSVNQDAMVRLIGWAGNMTTSSPKFCAVLFD